MDSIIRITIKEIYYTRSAGDPLHCIYVIVVYRSGRISQRRYRKLYELPLSVRDFLTDEHYSSEHDYYQEGKAYRMHIIEYKGA